MIAIQLIAAVIGHLGISCVLFNRVHAGAAPNFTNRILRKATEKLIAGLALVPIPLFVFFAIAPPVAESTIAATRSLQIYLWICQMAAVFFIARWLYRKLTYQLPVNARKVSYRLIDIEESLGCELMHGPKAKLLNKIPGNQSTKLAIEHWEFQLKQLPEDLSGLKICQLSDLHFTGLIDRRYFETIVEHVNRGNVDLIFITGDIVDSDRCMDWVREVLSKLQSKLGIYYVLGNHDLLVSDQSGYRQQLDSIGFVAAADGNWHQLDIGAARLLIAGNELPWYRAATQLQHKNGGQPSAEFSILLSHSPDQIGWAIHKRFDLMFAGHTHGGQIRFPWVGPIIAPSRYGIKYASGTFRVRNVLMHVSRGLSGDEPIRINCPPELSFFTLRRDST